MGAFAPAMDRYMVVRYGKKKCGKNHNVPTVLCPEHENAQKPMIPHLLTLDGKRHGQFTRLVPGRDSNSQPLGQDVKPQ